MPLAKVGDHSVLFVHIPKTGGSSIEKYLAQQGEISLKGRTRIGLIRCSLHHLHTTQLQKRIEPGSVDWSFMVVRHPVARIISEYRYQLRKRRLIRNKISFSTWLSLSLGICRFNPYYRDNHFRPQSEFEYPGAEIFHFEEGVGQCLTAIASHLGRRVPEIPIWENPSPELDIQIRDEDLQRIKEFYADDFLRYGYGIDQESLERAGVPVNISSEKSGSPR
ncbi:sulfotransferase family 2 domain-containing protein [Solemya velum gill symbiont]|uniref:Sulfotransferase family protein n=1 Tax=Solemya velum gill symbiont TaxID=2340 RepID=A0A0B0H9R8_SOVGS|nr:sulfotransferase family 2 domain-containing protein [Solemya velum gill symbiont]KHF25367.1 hypothetical protein JV46_06880 [Solemya velum gill symbiont]OOZ15774.1 hypothetical protein BOW27_02320 [Solemya velum gill symbiont]OOZ18421.1 hypothetical protein BOW28_02505 [Solemya velum gill symbiont]OOZ20862.1 hypothetical protein BOW29_00490 [Solemya velum gill symbiont]OOZ23702.1 hypothetical protein BOW30_01435 [Solemya velum gill symbiont]